jgi:hypothetical protein
MAKTIKAARQDTARALRKAAETHAETAEDLERSADDIEEAARATAREAELLPAHDRPYKAEIAKVRADEARTLRSEGKVKRKVAARLEHQAEAEEKKAKQE